MRKPANTTSRTLSLVVDAHQHFRDISKFQYSYMNPERALLERNFLPQDLAPVLGPAGVDRTVVIQWANSDDEAQFLLGLAERNDFIAGVVVWADLVSPKIGRTLDALAKHPKLKGIRYHRPGPLDSSWMLDPKVLRGLAALAERDLTFEYTPIIGQMNSLPEVAKRVPALRIVLNHMGMPAIATGQMEPWASELKVAATCPNVYCKITGGFVIGLRPFVSAMLWKAPLIKPYVDFAIQQFSYDRCIWGSDWPPSLLTGTTYEEGLSIMTQAVKGSTEKERVKLFGGTANAFYKLF